MLRLRPSELTLTADHVEETFRRIAQRQDSRAPTIVTSRASGNARRPVLRRGPQRSTRDAITALGDIPILIPQPQQVTFTSVDEDTESDLEDETASSVDRIGGIEETIPPTQDGQTASALTAASSALRSMHLPFRLGRTRPKSSTQPTPDEQRSDAIDPSSANSSGHAVVGHPGSNVDKGATPARSTGSSDGPAELRGGGRSGKDRARAIPQDTSYAPSLLHQMQRLSSPRLQGPRPDPVKSEWSSGEDRPTLYLKGYFKPLNQTPIGIPYHFQAFVPKLPHTEPRRRSDRQGILTRSLSSGSVPAFSLPIQRPDRSESSTEDVFSTVPAPDLPMRPRRNTSSIINPQNNLLPSSSGIHHTSNSSFQVTQPSTRSTQLSSETSSASAAFSWPGSSYASRQSSSEKSVQNQFPHFQYDGAAGSREGSRGAGYTNRSLDFRASSDTPTRPTCLRSSIHPSPNVTTTAQHAISPLPSLPYTRVQGYQGAPQPSTSFISGGVHYIDAATAAVQDLRSPLDDYSEQYQRVLRAHHAQPTMPVQPNPFQHQFDGVDALRSRQSASSRQHSTVDDPRAPRVTDVRESQRHVLRATQRSSEHVSNTTNHDTQPYGRSSQGTRINQRSSENVPVNATSIEGRAPRNSQVQTQRAAYEQLQSAVHAMQAVNARNTEAAPSRFSMPQTTTRRDMSNRPRTQGPYQFASRVPVHQPNNELSSSPLPPLDQWRSSQDQVQASVPGRSPGVPPRIPTRHGSRQHSGEGPHRARTRSYRPGPTTAPPSLHLHPTHNSPLTSLALSHGSGTTSRRSRSPLMRAPTTARTHRRVPARQRNQENSNDGEVNSMRREEAAINSRYTEDQQQQDVMDETPPRIGRVERRMLE